MEPADKAKLTKLKNEVVAKSGFSVAHSSSASSSSKKGVVVDTKKMVKALFV